MPACAAYFEQEKENILRDYFTFLRFATISADPAYAPEMLKCADWLQQYLSDMGLNVELWPSEKGPVVFASDLRAGPDKETLLLYCHYDVQPVDPLEEWTSPPFEPTLREGKVYARGASDNKGQCFYTITALKAFLKTFGQFPLNIKFMIEGAEESGSAGLPALIEEKKALLKADYLLIVDSGLSHPTTPAVTLGARGLVTLQATVKEGHFDLHSGFAGGLAYNPNRALVEMLAKLYDAQGRVAIPGFYDAVVEISPQEKQELSFDFDEEAFHKLFGFKPTGMERGVSPAEANTLRPTIEINGIWGGYIKAGFKTVIPAEACAKISCRLVPNQTPEKIAELVTDFLIQNTPPGLHTEVEIFSGNGRGFRTPAHSHIAKLMATSYSQVFEKPAQKILIGGTIPISIELSQAAQAEMVLVGVGLADDRIHAPNEHFGLDRFEKGFLTICRAIELFR